MYWFIMPKLGSLSLFLRGCQWLASRTKVLSVPAKKYEVEVSTCFDLFLESQEARRPCVDIEAKERFWTPCSVINSRRRWLDPKPDINIFSQLSKVGSRDLLSFPSE